MCSSKSKMQFTKPHLKPSRRPSLQHQLPTRRVSSKYARESPLSWRHFCNSPAQILVGARELLLRTKQSAHFERVGGKNWQKHLSSAPMVGWLAGLLAGWLAGLLACWLAGLLACWLAGLLACLPVCQSVSLSVCVCV